MMTHARHDTRDTPARFRIEPYFDHLSFSFGWKMVIYIYREFLAERVDGSEKSSLKVAFQTCFLD